MYSTLRDTMHTLYYLRSLITYFILEVVPLEALLHRGDHVFEPFWPTHLNFLDSSRTVNNILLAKYYSWANLHFSSSSIAYRFAWICWILKYTEISDHHYQWGCHLNGMWNLLLCRFSYSNFWVNEVLGGFLERTFLVRLECLYAEKVVNSVSIKRHANCSDNSFL